MSEAIPVVNHLNDFQRFIPLTQGNIAEFGVYNGGSTLQLATFGRPVYAYDTFDGIPGEDFDAGIDHNTPGQFRPTHDVLDMFRSTQCIMPVIGRFAETLQHQPKWLKFGFVYLDADLYQSYRQVFDFLSADHLEKDYIILADDYQACKGAAKAVGELLANRSVYSAILKTQGIVISSMEIQS